MDKIPFVTLEYQHKEISVALQRSLLEMSSSNNFILGPKLQKFENEFSKFSNTAFCIGVGNGFDALKISLLSLGIKAGDEVIAPSHTFIASILAITDIGATPILIDADTKTYNIDYKKIDDAITKKTKAILLVHLYGNPCEIDKIQDIASQYNIPIIEDNAQAHGALYKGKITGSFGKVNATSFYPTKNLGALGDAGAITTNDPFINEQILKIRNYGSNQKYISDVSGCNSRLDEIQASILSIKLKKLEKWNKEKAKLIDVYKKLLPSNTQYQQITKNSIPAYHIFTIKVNRRNELQSFLNEKGIKTQIHYPIPPHLQKCCQNLGYKKNSFPITEELSNTLISLPLYIGLKEEQIQYICTQIEYFLNKNGLS